MVLLNQGNIEQDETVFVKSTFADYVTAVFKDVKLEFPDNATSSIMDVENKLQPEQKRYLAQYELMEEFPELKKDLLFRDLFPNTSFIYSYSWLGPSQTVSNININRKKSNNNNNTIGDDSHCVWIIFTLQ